MKPFNSLITIERYYRPTTRKGCRQSLKNVLHDYHKFLKVKYLARINFFSKNDFFKLVLTKIELRSWIDKHQTGSTSFLKIPSLQNQFNNIAKAATNKTELSIVKACFQFRLHFKTQPDATTFLSRDFTHRLN